MNAPSVYDPDVTVLDLGPARVLWSFDYTFHEGKFDGRTFTIGHWWDDEEDAMSDAADFCRYVGHAATYELRSRHSIGV